MANAETEDDETLYPSLESLFESSISRICPFGDILLVVKDDFHPEARFQVSSCILATSSTVFKALFSKNFAEGQRMRARAPGEIVEIPTVDSPLAMKHLLRLLHHADPLDTDGKMLTTSAMLDLAIIVDKYDCIEALRLPIDALLSKYVGKDDYKLGHLATAAFKLDQPEYFRHFTKELVFTKIMIQAEHFDKQCLELLPDRTISSLFGQQSIVRTAIAAQLTQFVQTFSEACKAAYQQRLVVRLLHELSSRGIWPIEFQTCSIRSFCSKIESVVVPNIATDNNNNRTRINVKRWDDTSRSDGENWAAWPSPRPRYRDQNSGWEVAGKSPYQDDNAQAHHKLKDMASNVRQLVVGVCIDCIRDRACRKPHRYRWSDTESGSAVYRVYQDSDGGSVYSKQDSDEELDVIQRGNKRPGMFAGVSDMFADADDFIGYWDDAW